MVKKKDTNSRIVLDFYKHHLFRSYDNFWMQLRLGTCAQHGGSP